MGLPCRNQQIYGEQYFCLGGMLKMSNCTAFWVYILKCSDGTLYTGQTIDISHRVILHNAGKGAIFTRGRRPVTLVFAKKTASRGEALKKEKEIRRLPKKAKELLIKIQGGYPSQ